MRETVRDCEAFMAGEQPANLVTVNADFVAQAYENEELRNILAFADRAVCDGMPLVWLSRLFNVPLPERIAGSDLVFQLFESCARRQFGVYFLGSDPETLDTVRTFLAERHPGLRVAGSFSPPFAPVDEWPNKEILAELRQTRPELLLVAVGCPKQEFWIQRYAREAGIPLSIGIGASLDFISGRQQRAPKWMRTTGLEWLWRMASNPKRLVSRYARDFGYLFLLGFRQAAYLLRRRRRKSRTPAAKEEAAARKPPATPLLQLAWQGRLQADRLDRFPLPENPDRPVLCDLQAVPFLDSAGIGHLVALVRACRRNGRACAFVVPPDSPVRKLVASLRMDNILSVFPDRSAAEAWLEEKSAPRMPEIPVRLHAADAAAFAEQMRPLVDSLSRGVVLRIPCDHVTFLDSMAVGELLRLKKQALAQQSDLFLADPSPAVLRTLELLHLKQHLLEQ